ncbi:BTB/POZ domain-containing protein [Phlyctema vagabunda]|uniref:BTB/POZ domain-containing protein n=1 Tax=Phlyctema vagabunda TaxID=108571 RepID=A0ABR4PAD2_9HELO
MASTESASGSDAVQANEPQDSQETAQQSSTKRKRSDDDHGGAEDARSSFLESMGTDMVDLYVGAKRQLFRVHKLAMCRQIEYFDKMFNGSFRETSELRASFPDDDPRAFDLLLGWIYTGIVKPLHVMRGPTGVRSKTWCGVLFYCLAEKFLLYELMDKIMTTLLECHKNERKSSLAVDAMDFVFEHTMATSPLRKYFTHLTHYIMHSGTLESKFSPESAHELFKKYDTVFLDFLRLMRASKEVIDPRTKSPCDFHWHKTPCHLAIQAGTDTAQSETQK